MWGRFGYVKGIRAEDAACQAAAKVRKEAYGAGRPDQCPCRPGAVRGGSTASL
jgi:hypothetical protein